MIEECLRHSDIIYNLVGRDYETKSALAYHSCLATFIEGKKIAGTTVS